MLACSVEFRYLESLFGYPENLLLRISLSRIFEKDREFFAVNAMKNLSRIRRLFMENSREQRTSFDEFRLHYFCTILYIRFCNDKEVININDMNDVIFSVLVSKQLPLTESLNVCST